MSYVTLVPGLIYACSSYSKAYQHNYCHFLCSVLQEKNTISTLVINCVRLLQQWVPVEWYGAHPSKASVLKNETAEQPRFARFQDWFVCLSNSRANNTSLSSHRWCVLYSGITIKSVSFVAAMGSSKLLYKRLKQGKCFPEGTDWPCLGITFRLAQLKLCILNPETTVNA